MVPQAHSCILLHGQSKKTTALGVSISPCCSSCRNEGRQLTKAMSNQPLVTQRAGICREQGSAELYSRACHVQGPRLHLQALTAD